jgi:hypothetical protein
VIEVESGAALASRNGLPPGGVGGRYVVNAEGRIVVPEVMLNEGNVGTQFMGKPAMLSQAGLCGEKYNCCNQIHL